MGAPKQKWTAEEEAALKAGIRRYGIGKWSTILKDPEFSTVLRARSNVDLKDKYRNLNCMVLGSRQKSRFTNKSNQLAIKQDENTAGRNVTVEKESEVLEGTSRAASGEISQGANSKKPISRLEDVILEAITKLKEPRGSSRPAISQYIVDHYSAPQDIERTVAANLKTLTENGRVIKAFIQPYNCDLKFPQLNREVEVPDQQLNVKNQYRIAPKSVTFCVGKQSQPVEDGVARDSPRAARNDVVILTKAMIDAELEKMKSMSAEEAAEAAAKAVAEAEAAIAEAEAAAREAEEAEAEAEAAQCFADAAQKALNFRTLRVW